MGTTTPSSRVPLTGGFHVKSSFFKVTATAAQCRGMRQVLGQKPSSASDSCAHKHLSPRLLDRGGNGRLDWSVHSPQLPSHCGGVLHCAGIHRRQQHSSRGQGPASQVLGEKPQPSITPEVFPELPQQSSTASPTKPRAGAV